MPYLIVISMCTYVFNKIFFSYFFQQLYLATGDSIASDEKASQQNGSLSLAEPVSCAGSTGPLLCSDSAVVRDGQQQDQLCVVCQYFPLSRALLPCRHTCICAVCFCK